MFNSPKFNIIKEREYFRNQPLLQSLYALMQRRFDLNILRGIFTGQAEIFQPQSSLASARSRICENAKQITFFESNTCGQRWAVESSLLERAFTFSRNGDSRSVDSRATHILSSSQLKASVFTTPRDIFNPEEII